MELQGERTAGRGRRRAGGHDSAPLFDAVPPVPPASAVLSAAPLAAWLVGPEGVETDHQTLTEIFNGAAAHSLLVLQRLLLELLKH